MEVVLKSQYVQLTKIIKDLKLIIMKYPIKGTLVDLIEIVPTKVSSMMASQERDENYIFTIDVKNGFLLVW